MSNYNPGQTESPGFTHLATEAQQDLLGSSLNGKTVKDAKIVNFKVSGKMASYRIPYFDMEGKPLDKFYRVKNIYRANIPEERRTLPKYTQPKSQPNHLYYPPNFMECVYARGMQYVFVVEGEKKALAMAQRMLPAIGIGGIWNWRSDVFGVNGAVAASLKRQLAKSDKVYIKWSDIQQEAAKGRNLATGFADFADFARYNDIQIILMPDLDKYKDDGPEVTPDIKANVFDAYIDLTLEFFAQGMSNVVMARPPFAPNNVDKWAIDDALREHEKETIDTLIQNIEDGVYRFPASNSIKRWLALKIHGTAANLTDSEITGMARAIISYYKERGTFYKDADTQDVVYIINNKLYELPMVLSKTADFSACSLGAMINTEMELKTNFFGGRLTKNLVEFLMEDKTLEAVQTYRMNAHTKDAVFLQLSDTSILKITAKGIKSVRNGTEGILFRQLGKDIERIDFDELKVAIQELGRKPRDEKFHLWEDFLTTTTVTAMNESASRDLSIKFYSLIFRLSPWLLQWRGSQLPLEWVLAEAGSGKTTLYNLRQMVLTGSPSLHAMPNKLEELRTLLSNSVGICVLDNAGKLPQEFSNELARIVTEPEPKIRLRKLYTTNTLYEAPIRCGVALTSISDAIRADDLVQRSVIITMESRRIKGYKEPKVASRVKWIAEQVMFLHQLFKEVDKDWHDIKLSRFPVSRLRNFEKLLRLGGRALAMPDTDIDLMLKSYVDDTKSKVLSQNYVYQVLLDCAVEIYNDAKKTKLPVFTTNQLTNGPLAELDDDYRIFRSPKQLYDFIKKHQAQVLEYCHIKVSKTARRLNGSSNVLELAPSIETYVNLLKEQEEELK